MEPTYHPIDSAIPVSVPHYFIQSRAEFDGHWRDRSDTNGFILEAWSQGFMVGALTIMTCITVAAMRKGVLLHKLILLEVCNDTLQTTRPSFSSVLAL